MSLPNRRDTCLALLGSATAAACTTTTPTMTPPNTAPGFRHVDWSHQASLYEVNVRQFTPEGTLAAFEAQLPRLAQMGVGALWFMPIQPIGLKHRKGGRGSYYAIRDHTAVNPEFGTLADFRRVVAKAHALGMKVLLDWVANHTAWDHPWTRTHKQRYKLDAKGEVYSVTFNAGTPQVEYWTDVVGLDYTRPGAQADLWPAMTEAMVFWLREADIDGFRCDVASLVPTAFWEQARVQLDAVKPVFMLAESDQPELHCSAFDMSYDWDLHERLREVAQCKADARALRAWWQRRQEKYPADAYRMNFTGNHDSNSWHGSDAEFYGSLPAFKAMAVLAATLPGMPLVYGGQEAYYEKRLQFFERDAIDWKDLPLASFYGALLALKRAQPALDNGQHGGSLQWHDTGSEQVVAYTRRRGASRVWVAVNLVARPQPTRVPGAGSATLPPWGWMIETG